MVTLIILFMPIYLIGGFIIMHNCKILDNMYYNGFDYKRMSKAVNTLSWCGFILALYLGVLLGIAINYRFNLI